MVRLKLNEPAHYWMLLWSEVKLHSVHHVQLVCWIKIYFQFDGPNSLAVVNMNMFIKGIHQSWSFAIFAWMNPQTVCKIHKIPQHSVLKAYRCSSCRSTTGLWPQSADASMYRFAFRKNVLIIESDSSKASTSTTTQAEDPGEDPGWLKFCECPTCDLVNILCILLSTHVWLHELNALITVRHGPKLDLVDTIPRYIT